MDGNVCYSLGVTVKQRIAELKSRVIDIDSDGYCLLRALQTVLSVNENIQLSNDDIAELLMSELMENASDYEQFITTPMASFRSEMERFILHGIYNRDGVDLVIPAICNALDIAVVVIQESTSGKCSEIRQNPTRKTGLPKFVAYLLRSRLKNGAEHFDAVVHGQLDQEMSVNETKQYTKKQNQQKYVQKSIFSMFGAHNSDRHRSVKSSGTVPDASEQKLTSFKLSPNVGTKSVNCHDDMSSSTEPYNSVSDCLAMSSSSVEFSVACCSSENSPMLNQTAVDDVMPANIDALPPQCPPDLGSSSPVQPVLKSYPITVHGNQKRKFQSAW